MARYSYGPMPVVAPDANGGGGDLVVQNATGGKMYQTNGDAIAQTNPLAIFDFNGVPISGISSGASGMAQWTAEQTEPGGFVRFGDLIVGVHAREVGPLAARAAAAETAAVEAATAAQAALQQLQDYVAANPGGGGGGGLPTGTTLDQIPNGADRLAMTLTERNKLAGVENNANRLLLAGAGTATTAMRSDRTFTSTDVGAVRSMSGVVREWFRTTAQGFPTAAEGALDGDWLIMDDA